MEDSCGNDSSRANGSREPAVCGNASQMNAYPAEVSEIEFYVEVVLLLVATVVGLIANITSIVVIVITPSMHTGAFLMLGHLSLNGLVLAAICMPVHVISVIQQRWTMDDIVCQVSKSS